MNREKWLNGWDRNGWEVLIGTGVHCAGCGWFVGLATIAITGDEKWPDKLPDWPFEEATCPLHPRALGEGPQYKVDRLTERMVALEKQRQQRS